MSDQNHNNVPNFPLRTGLLDDQESLSTESLNDLELNVTATVLTFTDKAVSLAAIYVEHDGRKVITKSDIRKGMAMEYFAFLDDVTLEDDVAQWRDMIKEDIDCCECETDDDEEIPENENGELVCPRCSKVVVYEDDEDEHDEDNEDDEDEFVSGQHFRPIRNCQCSVCICFRGAEAQLEAYRPTDPMATLLRDNILRMETY